MKAVAAKANKTDNPRTAAILETGHGIINQKWTNNV
jgi:hypothetical protein